jgi:hypothetical protein
MTAATAVIPPFLSAFEGRAVINVRSLAPPNQCHTWFDVVKFLDRVRLRFLPI